MDTAAEQPRKQLHGPRKVVLSFWISRFDCIDAQFATTCAQLSIALQALDRHTLETVYLRQQYSLLLLSLEILRKL